MNAIFPLDQVVQHIRQSRQLLKQIQQEHVKLRSQYLEELATARVLWRNSSLQKPEKAKEFQKKRERKIRRIKRKEDLSRMHRRVGFTLRPDQERGGLNCLDVPTSDQQRPFPQGPDPKE